MIFKTLILVYKYYFIFLKSAEHLQIYNLQKNFHFWTDYNISTQFFVDSVEK